MDLAPPATVTEVLYLCVMGLLTALLGIITYLGKKYITQLERHVEDCNKRAVAIAINTTKSDEVIESLCTRVDALSKRSHWIADCIQTIAGKVGASIPPRLE